MWLIMAILSAFFAGITSILAKCGIKNTDSDVATAIRTMVVLVCSLIMVLVVGSLPAITTIELKSLIFLILSGLATGASWLCYFKALTVGKINKVVPIDKSSTILSILFAIFLLGETKNLVLKLVCTAFFAIGIFLMVETKSEEEKETKKIWLPFAIASAIFAALTSILAKIGIENVESNLGTMIRTIVVLFVSIFVVFLKKKQSLLLHIPPRELCFIILSGIATGASWLCYYYAIQKGIVSVVVPIDKLSILVTIVFSTIVFKEKIRLKSSIGLALMVVSTITMAVFT